LFLAQPPGGNVRLVVVFAADGYAGKAPEDSKLANMIQGIGKRTLEEFFGRCVKLLGSSEIVIEPLERIEEALHLVGPGLGRRIVPGLLPLGHAERPVEKIADVREDLDGSTAILARLEIDVALRGVADDFAGAIGNGGQRMAEEVTGADLFMWHTGLR